MRVFCFLIFLTLFSQLLFAEVRTFYLKSGDQITGEIQSYNDSSKLYKVKTSIGIVSINAKDLKETEIRIYLKNGDRIQGILLKEDPSNFFIKSSIGNLTISKKNVLRVDFELEKSDDARPGEVTTQTWYFGEERLIDIFFDPTG